MSRGNESDLTATCPARLTYGDATEQNEEVEGRFGASL